MHPIAIYRAEAEVPGLAEKIQASASVAYLSPLVVTRPDDSARAALLASARESSKAAIDDVTLITFEDILATTGWNLNADVFTHEELWAARKSIEHKPINMEHDYPRIVGHVAASLAVDAAYAPIADDTPVDALPDVFHVKNESVLYRLIGDAERDEFMQNLEAEIAAGEWFVSMESFFSGFDYGILAEDGSRAILPRTNATAFLTKHMRQYGGSGVYKDAVSGTSYTLGRVMKNVHFKGKGMVRRPGNPNSVIFSKVDSFKASYEGPGYVTETRPAAKAEALTQEQHTMPEADVAALQAALATAEAKIKTLEDAQSAQAVKLIQDEADSLRTALEELTTKHSALEVSFSTSQTDLEAARKEFADLQELYNQKAARLEVIEAEKTAASRKDAIVAAGADASLAARLVERFAALDAEAFAAVIDDLKDTFKPAPAPEAPAGSKAESEKDLIDAAVVEDAAPLSVSDAGERDTAQSALTSWLTITDAEATAE